MRSVTINDIARIAGVSKTTVSRVLNKSGPVNPATEKRILELIKQFDYTPSTVARNLSLGESSTIAVLVPDMGNPYYADILQVINDEVMKRGLTMVCFNSGDHRAKDEKALEAIRFFHVKGLIYTSANTYTTKEELRKVKARLGDIQAPIVLMDRRIEGLQKIEGVYFDDFWGAYQATRAFLEKGHRRIALLNAQKRNSVFLRNRVDGYLAALEEQGIAPREDYTFCNSYLIDDAYAHSRALLQMADAPTAVLTCNNITTLGFLRAVRDLGLRVPGDVSHIGFDKIGPLDYLDHTRNYVERDPILIGSRAIETLFNRIMMPNKPFEDVVLKPRLLFNEI